VTDVIVFRGRAAVVLTGLSVSVVDGSLGGPPERAIHCYRQ
jgi:hypothetical protein